MAELGPSLVYGLCLAASAVCAFLLLHAWRATHTRLFFWTALGFVFLALNNLLLAANQAVPVLAGVPSENQGYVYLLRLAALVLIIAAVLRKNLGRR